MLRKLSLHPCTQSTGFYAHSIKNLTVNNQPYGLINDDIRLELCSPGRATFVILTDTPLTGIVELKAGWSDSNTYSWFIGYIESSITIDNQQQKLFCRELTATLNRVFYLGLRHVSVKDVLIRLSELTEISFAIPDAGYADRRLVNRLYPELQAKYHAPMLGRIERITKAPVDGGDCTLDEPLYAVDIQPLDEYFKDRGELFRDVVVGMAYAGQERGFFALPDPGCIVEFCFAYVSPKLIFIRGVISWGVKLPPLDTGEAMWHKTASVYQGYDKLDNWQRHTTASIHENCEDIRQCISATKQLLKAPKTWIGSDSENVLRILIDLMSTLESALNTLSSHTHNGGNVGAPDQSGDISGFASEISSISSSRLSPITE